MSKSLGVGAVVLLLLLVAGCRAAAPSDRPFAVPTATEAAVRATMAATGTPSPTGTAPPSVTPFPPPPSATAKPSISPAPTRPPATVRPTRTPAYGTAPAGQVLSIIEAIELEMEALRGLQGTAPLTRTLLTREALSDYLEQEFEEEFPPQEIAVDTRVLAAFDFVSEEIDLRQVLLDLYAAQVLGMYDPEADTLFVVSDGEFDLMDRLTLAHEYVHGLQDQTFGLEAFLDEDGLNDDEYLARLAVIEGDATLAMTQYFLAHQGELSPEELRSLQEEDVAGSELALEAAPDILRETLAFPYSYGTEFVALLQEGGWGAIDAVYAKPPQSTEQILHPQKYLEGDAPQWVRLAPLTDTLGIGWERLDSETLGEFQTMLYLAQQVEEATARRASAGWDGDRYAVYGRHEDEVLVLATVWDSEADREEFVNAYEDYATRKYGQGPDRTGRSGTWWQTPARVTCLSWSAERTLVVVGPDRAIVERVVAALAP